MVSLVVAIAAGGVGVGCAASDGGPNTTVPVATRRPLIGDISVVAFPVDLYPDPKQREPGCEVLEGTFSSESEWSFTWVRALPVTCHPGPQKLVDGNFYGIYRSSATAEVVEALVPRSTEVGEAELFYIDQADCTDDPYCEPEQTLVAVLTLNEPVVVDGVEYDVLNLYVDDSLMVEVDMDDILESLQRS